jgi:hypothetical protein
MYYNAVSWPSDFCQTFPPKSRKWHFRDPKFKNFLRGHAPGPPYRETSHLLRSRVVPSALVYQALQYMGCIIVDSPLPPPPQKKIVPSMPLVTTLQQLDKITALSATCRQACYKPFANTSCWQRVYVFARSTHVFHLKCVMKWSIMKIFQHLLLVSPDNEDIDIDMDWHLMISYKLQIVFLIFIFKSKNRWSLRINNPKILSK